jgi:hypothetical protein
MVAEMLLFFVCIACLLFVFYLFLIFIFLESQPSAKQEVAIEEE